MLFYFFILLFFCFFFFKQKTAYEITYGDWSSDVCSSDLGSLSGTDVPEAQDVLDLWPARILAIVGNSVGTLVVVGVALVTFRSRPIGNALILAGIAVAGIGSGLAGLGIGALAPAIVLAALLLYAGFVAPTTLAKPRP